MTAALVIDITGVIIVIMCLALSVISARQIKTCKTTRRWILLLICITGLVNAFGFATAVLGVFGIPTVVPGLGRPGALLFVGSLLYLVIYDRYDVRGC